MKFAIIIAVLLGLLGGWMAGFSSTALAQEEIVTDTPAENRQEILDRRVESVKQMTWNLLKVSTVLLLVCLIAFFSLRWILPKVSRYSGFTVDRDAVMKVVTRFPLEPRKSIYLVQVGEGYHLLGVGDESVTYLTALSEKEIGPHLATLKTRASAPKSFLQIFSAKMSKNEKDHA